MLAVRIHRYGNRDALSLDDIPVPDIARAHALSESRRAVGKIVLLAGTP